MIDIKTLEKKEAEIKKVNSLADRLTERGKIMKEQYVAICNDLVALGINPKDPKEKERLAAEIAELEKKINELLPDNVLEKYAAMTVEELLDDKALDSLDLNQDF